MDHLHRDGRYGPEKTKLRLYKVQAQFPNPNADYDVTVSATGAVNAMWVASERLIGTGASIGRITRA